MHEKVIGTELREYNEKIVKCLLQLKEQRNELAYIIEKQYEERTKLETEMERITYKLCLINKSLTQRLQAKSNYDKTIAEIEEKYEKLVENSGELMVLVQNEVDQLDFLNNKQTSTEDAPKITQTNSENMDHTDNISNISNMGNDENNGSNRKQPCQTKNRVDCKCDQTKDENATKFSKLTQAKLIDPEVPTKLEKDDFEKTSMTTSISVSDGKGQSVSGEEINDEDDDDLTETSNTSPKQKPRLTAAEKYKELSLRESIMSYQESIDPK